MTVLRKVALGLVLAALAALLLLAALELWNYRQWASLPLREPGLNEDNRALVLEDRMDLLTKRVGDMELLVLILLGTSSVYALVIVVSSYLSATSFSRQANQTIRHMQDQIGLAMGDLRELQERTEQRVEGRLAGGVAGPGHSGPTEPAEYDRQIAAIAARLTGWLGEQLTEESKLELVRDESTAAHLDGTAGSELGAPLSALYLDFSRVYATANPGCPIRRDHDSIWNARSAWPRPIRRWHLKSITSWPADTPPLTSSRALLRNSLRPSSINSARSRNGWPETSRKAVGFMNSLRRRRSTKPSTICC